MNKKLTTKKIFVEDLFGILSQDISKIPWPSRFSFQDKIKYLDKVRSVYESFEDYDKCKIIIDLKNILQEQHDKEKKS